MMRRFGVVMVLVALGCNQGMTEEVPPPGSGVGPSNVAPPAMGANGLCHDLTPAGAVVTDQVGAAPPALPGGAMVDGRYVLTRYEWYTPNQLHTRTITLVVSGGGLYGQYLWTRNQEPEHRSTVNIATNGTQIAMRAICPVGQDPEWDQYGMTDTGLTLYSSRDSKAAFFSRQ